MGKKSYEYEFYGYFDDEEDIYSCETCGPSYDALTIRTSKHPDEGLKYEIDFSTGCTGGYHYDEESLDIDSFIDLLKKDFVNRKDYLREVRHGAKKAIKWLQANR